MLNYKTFLLLFMGCCLATCVAIAGFISLPVDPSGNTPDGLPGIVASKQVLELRGAQSGTVYGPCASYGPYDDCIYTSTCGSNPTTRTCSSPGAKCTDAEGYEGGEHRYCQNWWLSVYPCQTTTIACLVGSTRGCTNISQGDGCLCIADEYAPWSAGTRYWCIT